MAQPSARSAPASSHSAGILHLLDGNAVAINGSKFKAVNHREKNFTKDRLAKRIAAIESTIERYLKELDRADREQEVTGGNLEQYRFPSPRASR